MWRGCSSTTAVRSSPTTESKELEMTQRDVTPVTAAADDDQELRQIAEEAGSANESADGVVEAGTTHLTPPNRTGVDERV
jgi:hypothetical protein